MSADISKQTVPGSYRIVNIDGEDVMLHKVGSRWVDTRAKIEEETAEFDARWADTEGFKPGEAYSGPITGNVQRKRGSTASHVDAFLGEIFGCNEPDGALQLLRREPAGLAAVAQVRAHPGHLRHALALIRLLNDPGWNAVRDELLTDRTAP